MDLKEWAESLYRSADPKLADYGKEILDMILQEAELDRLYEIEEDLEDYAKRLCIRENEPRRIIEKMADECEIVRECQIRLAAHDFPVDDLDDQVEELARTVADIKETLEKFGKFEIEDVSEMDSIILELCQRPQFDL